MPLSVCLSCLQPTVVRARTEYREPTQEERLAEAVETEILNAESLRLLLTLEEEMKLKRERVVDANAPTAPMIRYFSSSKASVPSTDAPIAQPKQSALPASASASVSATVASVVWASVPERSVFTRVAFFDPADADSDTVPACINRDLVLASAPSIVGTPVVERDDAIFNAALDRADSVFNPQSFHFCNRACVSSQSAPCAPSRIDRRGTLTRSPTAHTPTRPPSNSCARDGRRCSQPRPRRPPNSRPDRKSEECHGAIRILIVSRVIPTRVIYRKHQSRWREEVFHGARMQSAQTYSRLAARASLDLGTPNSDEAWMCIQAASGTPTVASRPMT